MKNKLVLFICFLFLASVSASTLGYTNPNLPKLNSPDVITSGGGGITNNYYNVSGGDARNWSSYLANSTVNLNTYNITNTRNLVFTTLTGIPAWINYNEIMNFVVNNVNVLQLSSLLVYSTVNIRTTKNVTASWFIGNINWSNVQNVPTLFNIAGTGLQSSSNTVSANISYFDDRYALGNSSFNQTLTDSLYQPKSTSGSTTFSFSGSKFMIKVT